MALGPSAVRNAVRGGFMRSAWPEDLLGPDLDERIWAEVTAESFKFVVAASKSCVNFKSISRPVNGSASTTFLDSPRLAGCRQTWHGALVVRKDETSWRDPLRTPVVSVDASNVEPAKEAEAPAALAPLALSTPRPEDLAGPAAAPMDFASMDSIVTSSHMSPKVKATWQLEAPLPSDGHDRTQAGKSRGYKSALDLLRSKQIGSQGLTSERCDRTQAGKSPGYKSALDLLRPKQIASQGPTARRSRSQAHGKSAHKSALDLLREVSAAADPSFRKRRNANSRAAGARGARRARGKPKVAALPVIEHHYIHKHIHRHHIQVMGGPDEAFLAAERLRQCTETPLQKTLMPKYRSQGLGNSMSLPNL